MVGAQTSGNAASSRSNGHGPIPTVTNTARRRAAVRGSPVNRTHPRTGPGDSRRACRCAGPGTRSPARAQIRAAMPRPRQYVQGLDPPGGHSGQPRRDEVRHGDAGAGRYDEVDPVSCAGAARACEDGADHGQRLPRSQLIGPGHAAQRPGLRACRGAGTATQLASCRDHHGRNASRSSSTPPVLDTSRIRRSRRSTTRRNLSARARPAPPPPHRYPGIGVMKSQPLNSLLGPG